MVIIQHDKARSASGRPTTRDAQHPESGVLNSYRICTVQYGLFNKKKGIHSLGWTPLLMPLFDAFLMLFLMLF